MTPDDFRELALALPDAEESEHQGHPDFRVGGKIFATLGPDGSWGMVKLTPEAQERCAADEPEAYEPLTGAWGRQGCTKVHLEFARKASVRKAMKIAWTKLTG